MIKQGVCKNSYREVDVLKQGIFAGIVLAFLGAAAFSEDAILISDKIRVVDGDTIALDGRKIRLLGIDAPEMGQQCFDDQGNSWHCGKRARDMLLGMLATAPAPVSCRINGQDRYKRLLGRCFAGTEDAGLDVQRALVRAGFAVAEYTRDYRVEEDQAEAEQLGLWAGEFMRPKDWRRARRQQTGSGS